MGKLIKYALLAALIYFAVIYALPLVEKVTDVGSSLSRRSGVTIGDCVPQAEGASEYLSRGLRNFSSPPIDVGDWELFMEELKGRIYDAESVCGCPRESCQKAREALVEVGRLAEDFDNTLRAEGAPLNPVRQQETIDSILKRARELERQGS